MELLVPHECHYCGEVSEAKFLFSGPHLKQVCNGCGRYVKFFSKGAIPDKREVRLKIWSITQDISKIEEAKKNVGFIDNLKGLDEKIMFWRLYLEVRRMEALR